jgi:RNA polymerase sigma factor (TIGR02999 family)
MPVESPNNPTAPARLAPDGADMDQLWASAYEELRQLARARLRRSGPFTLLDTTGLVNDTYMRMAKARPEALLSRQHFFAYCARVMRSVVIDLARENAAARRGSDPIKLTLSPEISDSLVHEEDPQRVDEAVNELARVEPRLAQVVELRYFGGFMEQEIAEALDLNVRTVRRDWKKACMLMRALLAPQN